MINGALKGPSANLLAVSFARAIREICPDFSDARIAANIGETRQNFSNILRSQQKPSTDRVIAWICRWNEAHPTLKVFLVVKGEVDLEVCSVSMS